MASFTPPEPPFEPDEPTPPPTLSVPLPPPEVGEGSPWAPADSENRDRILDWWRMWFRRVFFPWIAAFITYWDVQWNRLAMYINTWITAADEYITEHAIAGYGFRPTATDIAGSGTTNVVFTGVDAEHRPVIVGDLALDESVDGNFGIVTVVIDATHATVQYLGSLRGPSGYSWRLTDTPIADSGTTNVDLEADAVRPISLGDLVLDTAADGNFGVITALIDATHATVTFAGSLRGPDGIDGTDGLSWRFTATDIAGSGTTNVSFAGSPDPALHVGDLVVSTTTDANFGYITVVIDATNATVSSLGSLKGAAGADGLMHSVVAGANVTIDDTDPANPIVTAHGVYRFINFARLHQLIDSGGNTVTPQDGDLGVVTPDADPYFQSAIWVYFEGEWITPQIWLTDNDPNNWALFVTTGLNLPVNTSLNMAGAVATEIVRGTHPVWVDSLLAFRQDKLAPRRGAIDDQAPAGSVVRNDDNTYTLTACTMAQIDLWLPTLALDGTDEATLKINGTMSANGDIFVRLSQQANGPDSGNHYGGYSGTQQYTPGSIVVDTPGASNPATNDTKWALVVDSTGSPLVVEGTVNLKNLASPVFPALARLHSLYYLDDFSESFERVNVGWNVQNVGGANPFRLPNGIQLLFTDHAGTTPVPFTGTIRLESNF